MAGKRAGREDAHQRPEVPRPVHARRLHDGARRGPEERAHPEGAQADRHADLGQDQRPQDLGQAPVLEDPVERDDERLPGDDQPAHQDHEHEPRAREGHRAQGVAAEHGQHDRTPRSRSRPR